MKIKNVAGIIWDLDGTLIDSFSIFEQIIADVVKESGHTMPSHDYMLLNYHGSLEETVQRILGIQSAKELDRLISVFLKKQERHYAGDLNTHLFKDATMLAQNAAKQGIHQLLVTNRAHKNRGTASPKVIIATTVLADCIHEVLPGDEVTYRKPDIRSTGDWMKRNQLLPEDVVVIGDQFVDAQLAQNLGARAVLVKRSGDIPHLSHLQRSGKPTKIEIVDSLDAVELVR
jgi:phosphoglycolate phosphatase-like HAD superfamily hydrolase